MIKRAKKLLAAIALAALPAAAYAGGVLLPGGGSSVTGDQIVQAAQSTKLYTYFNSLFGALVSGSGPQTAIGYAISYFNAGVIAMASLFLFYNLTAAVAQSAHEGEVLGKRWSSLWAPIRLLVGSVGLMPYTGGFTIAQKLLLSAALLGSGFGDLVWQRALNAVVSQDAPISYPIQRDPTELAHALYDQAVCVNILNVKAETEQSSDPFDGTEGLKAWDPPSLPDTHTAFTVTPAQTYSWRPNNTGTSMGYDASTCGSVSLQWGISVANTDQTQTADELSALQDIYSKYDEAVKALAASMYTIAKQVVLAYYPATEGPGGTGTPPDFSLLTNPQNGAVAQYTQSIQAAVQKYQQAAKNDGGANGSAQKAMTQAANAGGWLEAGAWYIYLTKVNATVLAATNFTPKTVAPTYEGAGGGSSVTILINIEAAAENWWKRGSVTGASQAFTNQAAINATTAHPDVTSNSAAIHAVAEKMVGGTDESWRVALLNHFDPNSSQEGTDNPIHFIMGLGNTLIYVGDGILTASLVMKVASLASVPTKLMSILSGLSGGISSIANWAGFALLAAGEMLATVFPMQPYLIFTVAAFGYLVLVGEAILAAPLWAFAHLHMEGEGIAGQRAGEGYMLLMSLLFRPALMVLGMLLGMGLLSVGLMMIHDTFVGAMQSAIGSDFGVINTAIVVCIFVGLIIAMTERCFQLIHIIPDRVLRMVGASSHGDDQAHAGRATALGNAAANQSLQLLSRMGGAVQGFQPREIRAPHQAASPSGAAAAAAAAAQSVILPPGAGVAGRTDGRILDLTPIGQDAGGRKQLSDGRNGRDGRDGRDGNDGWPGDPTGPTGGAPRDPHSPPGGSGGSSPGLPERDQASSDNGAAPIPGGSAPLSATPVAGPEAKGGAVNEGGPISGPAPIAAAETFVETGAGASAGTAFNPGESASPSTGPIAASEAKVVGGSAGGPASGPSSVGPTPAAAFETFTETTQGSESKEGTETTAGSGERRPPPPSGNG